MDFCSLVTRSRKSSRYSDLKGKTVSVDAMTTGYAFVLLDLLKRNGLSASADYKVERAGGVMRPLATRCKRGKHAGTMLISPFEV